MVNSAEGITVGYWTIRGLGAPLRAMVMYAGVPLNNVMYDTKELSDGTLDRSAWSIAKPALKAKCPLINLPYIIDGDRIVSQSNACLSYLGRRLNLWGKTPDEVSDCEMLLCELIDLRNSMTGFAYGTPKPLQKEAATKFLDGVQSGTGIFQKLELWLEQKASRESVDAPGCFLVGNSATAPDFHLHEMLVQYSALAAYNSLPFLEGYPRLVRFKNEFEALPNMQKYLNTPFGTSTPQKLPFNQKSACFGASPCGASWIPGTCYEYESYSGKY